MQGRSLAPATRVMAWTIAALGLAILALAWFGWVSSDSRGATPRTAAVGPAVEEAIEEAPAAPREVPDGEREVLAGPGSGRLGFIDPVAEDQAGLWGRVIDEAGVPVAAAEVLLQVADADGALGWVAARVACTSDAQGVYRIPDAPLGLVRLAARTPRAAGEWTAPLRLEPGSPRESVLLVVREGLCQRGTVRDRESGEGIAAELSFHPLGPIPPLEARSHLDGAFEVCGLRPDTPYVIAVGAEGYRALSGPNVLEVSAVGSVEPLELLLERLPEEVHLRVVDGADGTPIGGVELAWAVPAPLRLPRTLNALAARGAGTIGRTDAAGLVRLPPVPSGMAGVLSSAIGYAPRLLSSGELSRGALEPLVVELLPGHGLEVRLEGLDSGAAADVDLYLAPRHPGMIFLSDDPIRRQTAAAGQIARFEGLPLDRYVAVARAADRAPAKSPILALEEPGGRTAIALALGPGASLGGTVRPIPAGSQPLVRAVGPDGFEARTQIAPGGSYRLSALPAGRLWIWAEEQPLRPIARSGRLSVPPFASTVTLAEGSETRLDLEFEGPASSLSGLVAIDGRPAPGMVVRAEARWPSALQSAREAGVAWSDLRTTWTDSEGRFRLTDLRGEGLRLSAMFVGPANGRLVLVERDLDRGSRDETIELRAEVARLSVQVLRWSDRSPLHWARIELQPDPARGGVPGFRRTFKWSFDVRGAGRASSLPLPAGAYLLLARGPDGLAAEAQPVLLVAGSELDLELLLHEP